MDPLGTPGTPGTPDPTTPGVTPGGTVPPLGTTSPDLAAGSLEPTKDDKTMALLAHLLGILTSVIGPLIIWAMKKDTSPFLDDQGKEAMNFQITALIGWVIVMVLAVVTCGIGGFLVFPLWIAIIVLSIMAGIKAQNGERYRYPFTLRLIK